MMSAYLSNKRICVTGGAGFLGRAVCSALKTHGASDVYVPRSRQYDLTQPGAVARLFVDARPDIVIHLAAEVGGIGANRAQPGRFFYANMAMGLHLIEEARRRGVDKFVQVGTVCAYPKHCAVPFREEDLWNGYPEETNAPYGVAKRALSVMLDAYRAQYGFNGIYLLPVNLYGPGDNFDPDTSHVIPALVRRFCAAADRGADAVTCWGTGNVTRDFLYVDDAAEAIATAAAIYSGRQPINLGTGREIAIADLAVVIARLCGFHGRIDWDTKYPDGQPRRRLDTKRAADLLKWQARGDLEEGLRRTVEWWRNRRAAPGPVSPSG